MKLVLATMVSRGCTDEANVWILRVQTEEQYAQSFGLYIISWIYICAHVCLCVCLLVCCQDCKIWEFIINWSISYFDSI